MTKTAFSRTGVVRLALCATLVSLLVGALPGFAAAQGSYAPGGPMDTTKKILQSSNRIVTGPGDRNQKLAQLKNLLKEFLDTDALGKRSMGKHLEGKTPEQQRRFLDIFRDLFVRTYVTRLLLFDAPDFAYGKETITGDTAKVGTEIVTPRDRFAVDYEMRKTPQGWQATDILIEDVSLASNFKAQFDKALAKDSFDGLLDKLQKKLSAKPSGEDTL